MDIAKKYHLSFAMSTGEEYVEEFQKVRIRSRIYDNDRKACCSAVYRTRFTGASLGKLMVNPLVSADLSRRDPRLTPTGHTAFPELSFLESSIGDFAQSQKHFPLAWCVARTAHFRNSNQQKLVH